MKKAIILYLTVTLLVYNSVQSHAQAAFTYDLLLSDLESQLQKGNRRALRDAATLLDKPTYTDAAIVLLEKYTFFQKNEIDLTNTTRAQFMDFYFKNTEKIRYSEVLRGFYITPIEYQTYNFTVTTLPENLINTPSVLLRNLTIEFDKTLKTTGNTKVMQQLIEKIAVLETPESFQWLRNMLSAAPFNKKETDLYIALCEGLKNEPNPDNLTAVLKASEKGYASSEFLTSVLIELTNYAVSPQQTQMLLDSLETFEALRAYGYDKALNFREAFFYEKVDYYGKILSRKDTPWIQRNALRDLLVTEMPRLLFYIAAQLRLKPDEANYYADLLKKLTKTQFSLPQKAENTVSVAKTDWAAQLAFINTHKEFLRYWANHAEDFEWDGTHRHFVNKADIAKRTENYEKLFRRLNSENDSVAFASFSQLAQGDPTAIAQLVEKYRPLLRIYNKHLPDIRYGYLEQMTQLVSFCRKTEITYTLKPALDSLLTVLAQTRNPMQRYIIENQFIKSCALQDITGLEYYGCLYSGNTDMAFSIGRMLDYLYSKFWKNIKHDETQLRLFLKKSFLFKKIGVVGICGSYQNKMDNMDIVLKNKLQTLARLEDDTHILNQIQFVLGADINSDAASSKPVSMIEMFINDPLSFANNDLRLLAAPQASDYQRIIEKVQSESEREIIRLMLDFLSLHPSIEAVPSLFAIIGDDRRLNNTPNDGSSQDAALRVSDKVVELLEMIYGHSYKVEDKRLSWRKLWYKDGKNHRQWDKQFFEEQILFLTTATNVKIDDLLEVSTSKYVTDKNKPLIINCLKNLELFSDVRRFKSKVSLKASSDLASFDRALISHKDLDDFIKIFEVDKDTLMWRFINEKSNNYSLDELGSFYNSLFKVNWFTERVVGEQISPYQKDLAIIILQNYLTNSEMLSDFEEQTTLLHIAELQNIGRSLTEKLEATFALDISEEAKATIQEAILARIDFVSIKEVAPYFDKLSRKPGYIPLAFLYKDFGIPFFSSDATSITQLINNQAKMNPLDFYKYYLKQFGVDFLKDDKITLDFTKIYNILKFEIVAPFTGGGSQRDYFTYGIIKVLELHFSNRLGFHEKLNENQTFYTYSAAKRATKWMQYLETKHFVSPDPSQPSSFNRLYAGN